MHIWGVVDESSIFINSMFFDLCSRNQLNNVCVLKCTLVLHCTVQTSSSTQYCATSPASPAFTLSLICDEKN